MKCIVYLYKTHVHKIAQYKLNKTSLRLVNDQTSFLSNANSF